VTLKDSLRPRQLSIRSLGLRQNISWAFLGNTIYAALQWAIVVVLAKFGPVEAVGHFTLGYAVAAPIFMFCDLQLRAVQSTDVQNEFRFSEYAGLRLLTTLVASILVAIIGVITGETISLAFVVAIVGLIKSSESINDVTYGALQRIERLDLVAQSMILRGVVLLTVTTVLYVKTRSLEWTLVGMLVGGYAVAVVFDLLHCGRLLSRYDQKSFISFIKPKFDASSLRLLAQRSLPLGIGVGLVSLTGNIPRYILEHSLGSAALGYFGAIAFFAAGSSRVASAITQAARPRLAHLATLDSTAFTSLLRKLLIVLISLGVLGVVSAWLLGEEILRIFYGSEYAAYVDAFLCLTIALVFQWAASVYNTGLHARRIFSVQPYIAGAEVVVAFLSGVILIPRFGVIGASLTVLASSAFRLVITWVLLRRLVAHPNRSVEPILDVVDK